MTNENLEIIKNMAIQLLYLDAIPTCTIGGIQQVSHPVFDENPMVWMDDDKQFQTADILTDRKGIKKARARWKSIIKSSESVGSIFFVLRKGYWLPFLQAIKQYMDNAEFSGFFGEIWTQVESPNMNARVSLDTLVEWFKEADKSHLMSKDELKAYHELPDELRIYRGIGEKSNPKGLSWTLNKEKAEWFANRYNMLGTKGYVVTAVAQKKDGLAYFTGREEDEVIIDGRKLDAERI